MLKMRHCNGNFDCDDTWFLKNLNSYTLEKNLKDRRLLIGVCPHCGKDVVTLEEVRVFDNRYFVTTVAARKEERKHLRIDKIMKRESSRIHYKASDVKKKYFRVGLWAEYSNTK
jgi:hypothetical protein